MIYIHSSLVEYEVILRISKVATSQDLSVSWNQHIRKCDLLDDS